MAKLVDGGQWGALGRGEGRGAAMVVMEKVVLLSYRAQGGGRGSGRRTQGIVSGSRQHSLRTPEHEAAHVCRPAPARRCYRRVCQAPRRRAAAAAVALVAVGKTTP